MSSETNRDLYAAMCRLVATDEELRKVGWTGPIRARKAPEDASTLTIFSTLSTWGDRQHPLPRENWFDVEGWRAYFKECHYCHSLHFFTPRKPGLFAEALFVCIHCEKKADRPGLASRDQGVFVGSAMVDGKVAFDWHSPCMICRTEFFRTVQDKRKVRRTPGSNKSEKRRLADAAKEKERDRIREEKDIANPPERGRRVRGTLAYAHICERCNGSSGEWKRPDAFVKCGAAVRKRCFTRLYEYAVKRVGVANVDPMLFLHAGKTFVPRIGKLKEPNPDWDKIVIGAPDYAKKPRKKTTRRKREESTLDITDAMMRKSKVVR